MEGDSLELLKTLPDETFDSVITDPPYGMGFSSFHRNTLPTFGKIPNDEVGQPFIWWIYDAFRILKPGGSVICFCNWQNDEAFKLALQWGGFTVRSQVVWDRGNHGMGDLEGTFGPMHDIIWYATKGKGRFYATRPLSVIRVMRPQGAALKHPNEKPIALMRHLVRSVSPPGGVVVDPFAGSGSTGVACMMEGRTPVLMELLEYNCNIIRKRMSATQLTFDMEYIEEQG